MSNAVFREHQHLCQAGSTDEVSKCAIFALKKLYIYVCVYNVIRHIVCVWLLITRQKVNTHLNCPAVGPHKTLQGCADRVGKRTV